MSLRNLWIVIVVVALVFSGCKDEEQPPELNIVGGEILIANEGNFGWGEGTLSLYNSEEKSIQNEVYKNKNAEPIGNVFQSIAFENGKYFFVANNSGKVVIADTSFTKEGEIAGFTSPRYCHRVSDDKMYVTDLYANAISVIDMKALQVVNSIPTNGWSEKGIVLDGLFWFTAPETDFIYGVDIATDEVIDSVDVGAVPESIGMDNDRNIWVLCKGDEDRNKSAVLVTISDVENKTLTSIDIDGVPISLTYDAANNRFLYINEGIWEVDATSNRIPTKWIEGGDKVYYKIGVNSTNGEIYLSDIVDYVSKSKIERYSTSGELLDEFYAGIIAGDFFFP